LIDDLLSVRIDQINFYLFPSWLAAFFLSTRLGSEVKVETIKAESEAMEREENRSWTLPLIKPTRITRVMRNHAG
jgi:hypothetical protein